MSLIPEVLRSNENEILSQWLSEMAAATRRHDLMRDDDLRSEAKQLLGTIVHAAQSGNIRDVGTREWAPVIDMLTAMSRSRAQQGFTPSETAIFVLSLKRPIFAHLRNRITDAKSLAEETWATTEMIDNLGLHTMEAFQKAREEVINRQQQELLELSTPVVKLWDRVLALPLIGTLDSQRTQVVMETLLQQIVAEGAEVAIIDITGVPTVDTLVAQHLLKTITAARLMGADCIISGIRPSTAQTIVHLGVDLADVVTKASLMDAFRLAMQRIGLKIAKRSDDSNKAATRVASADTSKE